MDHLLLSYRQHVEVPAQRVTLTIHLDTVPKRKPTIFEIDPWALMSVSPFFRSLPKVRPDFCHCDHRLSLLGTQQPFRAQHQQYCHIS